MAKSKWEVLQGQIDEAKKPLETRTDTYREKVKELRLTLEKFFINEANPKMLTETAKPDEVVFDFNLVKKAMKNCLVEEEQLIKTAVDLQEEKQLAKPSVIDALDYHIQNSGLPVIQTATGYQFTPEKPYTANAQAFMQQFALAINVYRAYLSIYEKYFTFFSYTWLDTNTHQEYLEQARELAMQAESATSETDWYTLLQNSIWLRNNITALFDHSYIRQGVDDFEKDMLFQVSELAILYEGAAKSLSACYSHQVNSGYSNLFFDSPWQKLLKGVAQSLFDNRYSASWYYGTLEIDTRVMANITREITTFYLAAMKHCLDYRVALLQEALETVNRANTAIYVKAAQLDVSLQAPRTPSTRSSAMSSVYELWPSYFNKPMGSRPDVSAYQSAEEDTYLSERPSF
ncbi:hypothetical protein [Legionella spiritensis]|uniref:hypothetical protein n=1 Tax=Legionella spiritensis TaxID=452 RepID=UPI000F6D3324|nr:hypothetical protein [Legionella spiritensis]VEG91700.1 coiled-coil protein [Legionella spiritensis]